ncbi:hypothetical protein [Companilactobacillus jidongensis]|uniref:hypothetical protein n=1 Tax=Companilactobacillus jidongensis TaxID=2486006 RepID=UPI000F78A6B8|nr:hypothetical protein [Companilactobacillus jidongensis]
MKVRILFNNFINSVLQNFLYPTLLLAFLAFELTMNSLLNLNTANKFGFLIVGIFLMSLLTSMNFLKNDVQYNEYFMQKIGNYWLYFSVQVLTLFLITLFSAIVVFLFSFMLSSDIMVDIVAILSLATTGFVGVGIAFLCKPQWNHHPYAGQMGIIILVYVALAGSSIDILKYVSWFLPPVSKMITIFQEQSSIRALVPIVIQQFVYACVLIVLSGTFYEKKLSN